MYVPDIFSIKGVDFGVLGALAIISIYSTMIFIIYKLIKMRSLMIQLYGLSLIYLLIHSFKFPLMFFTYPYWIFMLSAGYIFLTVSKK